MKSKLLILAVAVFSVLAIHPSHGQVAPGRRVAPKAIVHPVATVMKVQRVLIARGLYNGRVDGVMGPGTRAGIRTYQARHGIPVTGDITVALLRSMGL